MLDPDAGRVLNILLNPLFIFVFGMGNGGRSGHLFSGAPLCLSVTRELRASSPIPAAPPDVSPSSPE